MTSHFRNDVPITRHQYSIYLLYSKSCQLLICPWFNFYSFQLLSHKLPSLYWYRSFFPPVNKTAWIFNCILFAKLPVYQYLGDPILPSTHSPCLHDITSKYFNFILDTTKTYLSRIFWEEDTFEKDMGAWDLNSLETH